MFSCYHNDMLSIFPLNCTVHFILEKVSDFWGYSSFNLFSTKPIVEHHWYLNFIYSSVDCAHTFTLNGSVMSWTLANILRNTHYSTVSIIQYIDGPYTVKNQ
jgi:hypothetical protein